MMQLKHEKLWLIVSILTICIAKSYCQWGPEKHKLAQENIEASNTCSQEDLDHSILVQCNQESQCKRDKSSTTGDFVVSDESPLVHIYSTRDGHRLRQERLKLMNLVENDFERSFNVNTTLTVLTKSAETPHDLYGFGATLDLEDMMQCLHSGTLDKSYKPLIRDLFSSDGAKMSILRLVLANDTLAKKDNIGDLLMKLDQIFADISKGDKKVELILDLDSLEWSEDVLGIFAGLSEKLNTFRSIVELTLANGSKMFLSQNSTSIIASTGTGITVNTAHRVKSSEEAATFVGTNKKELKDLKKLIIETNSSVPYNSLEYVRNSGSFDILTISRPRPKTKTPGDWHNAKDFAVEILNHLKYGSNGVIESLSAFDVTSDSDSSQDVPLYNLQARFNTHFRGPMYYAMSHFSRYLPRDSILLKTDLFTQPNMFAAHYGAFLVPATNHIVTIVLNDNDHILPFRLALDGQIKAHAFLDPKSFNTFILKR